VAELQNLPLRGGDEQMASLTEAQQRSFVRQVTEIMSSNKEELKKQGLDVSAKLKELQEKIATAEKAEDEQLRAQAAAKEKTAASVKATTEAYQLASSQVEAIVGSIGKTHPLSTKIKNIRDAMANEALRGKKQQA